MIPTKELRIGNFVNYKGEINVVAGVWNNRVKFAWQSVWSATCEDLEPIELTEEILGKAGFKKEALPGWWGMKPSGESEMMLIFKPEDDTFHYVDGAFGPELNYVHQLENVFFTLTGKELNIEL